MNVVTLLFNLFNKPTKGETYPVPTKEDLFNQNWQSFGVSGLPFTHIGKMHIFNRAWVARFHGALIFITCSGLPRNYRVFAEFQGKRYNVQLTQPINPTYLQIESAVNAAITQLSALPEMEEPDEVAVEG